MCLDAGVDGRPTGGHRFDLPARLPGRGRRGAAQAVQLIQIRVDQTTARTAGLEALGLRGEGDESSTSAQRSCTFTDAWLGRSPRMPALWFNGGSPAVRLATVEGAESALRVRSDILPP